ncbi:MAG: SpoIIE family protein phosphatase [Leptospiraceae bacterium]|nr:SpoIIE family protein phosphatase [Leptospiraceae bacterium]
MKQIFDYFSRFIQLTFYFLVFFTISLSLSAQKNIQQIDSLDHVVNLSSNQDSTWYVTKDAIEPQKYYQEWREGNLKDVIWSEYFVPGTTEKQFSDYPQGFIIWVKKEFILPKSWNAPHISLRLGVMSDRDKVYLNGKLIGKTGKFGDDNPQAYDKIRIYDIPTELLSKSEINLLLIQIQSYFTYEVGIVQDQVAIGPSSIITTSFYREEYFKLILLMAYFSIGCYFLFLFIRRRKDLENLYYGLFTLELVIYQFLKNQIKYEFGFNFFVMKKIEYISLVTLVPLFTHFIRSLFRFGYNKILRVLDFVSLVFLAYYLFDSNVENYTYALIVLQVSWIPYIVIVLYYIVKKLLEKNRDAMYIMIGMSIMITSVILDSLSIWRIIQFPNILNYGFLFFILSLATVLANKFVRLNEEVEDLNINLEKKVEKRTEQLHQSLKKVNTLKTQQDGDYFLTALLIKPLFLNNNKSSIVKTEFYTKQKKSFEFKGKTYEIGGDISISGNIELRRKRYIAFINGDAMGKSIQGAGGALVIGVVYNAFLNRFHIQVQKDCSPEHWLKELFGELQKVFESFNGSMYVSAVLGLVDEKTGFMYFVNTEHPWTVLYRDGKADFLEMNFNARKIGFPENEKYFQIKTFLLKPNDVIYVGSDGRDDLVVDEKHGMKVINEDENLFLRSVEKGKGVLEEVAKILQSLGSLSDDLSLIRLAYQENFLMEETFELEPTFREPQTTIALAKTKEPKQAILLLENVLKTYSEDSELLHTIAKKYHKIRDYKKAIFYFERYLELKPEDENTMLLASKCSKRNNDLNKATQISEQLFFRNPYHIRNLLNLAGLYSQLNAKKNLESMIRKLYEVIDESQVGRFKLKFFSKKS